MQRSTSPENPGSESDVPDSSLPAWTPSSLSPSAPPLPAPTPAVEGAAAAGPEESESREKFRGGAKLPRFSVCPQRTAGSGLETVFVAAAAALKMALPSEEKTSPAGAASALKMTLPSEKKTSPKGAASATGGQFPTSEYEALKRAIKRLERVLDRLYKKNEILLRRKQLMELEAFASDEEEKEEKEEKGEMGEKESPQKEK
ncbi:uncharacterized protein LOC128406265 [Podarcis raffonei]|uniref:uncharacterized protein LOC128406265 n=1 Tax=Podarcis raffonei TaxID=65483 RepID=UPI00232920D2|nr:uncharacterized protein LOC128406265 [Podarcis raffonei]